MKFPKITQDEALQWLREVVLSSPNGLFCLCGCAGTGKTHLLATLGTETRPVPMVYAAPTHSMLRKMCEVMTNLAPAVQMEMTNMCTHARLFGYKLYTIGGQDVVMPTKVFEQGGFNSNPDDIWRKRQSHM